MGKWFLGIGAVSLIWLACQSATGGEWKAHNLLRYDLPVTIMGPDSVVVSAANLMFSRDVTIEGVLEPGYGVQIFSSEASSMDPKKIKAQQLADTKEHLFFDQLIKDEPQGFIYSTKIDSANIYHGFKWVKVQGAREYIFQNLSGRQYSLEDVERMYQAIQGPPK